MRLLALMGGYPACTHASTRSSHEGEKIEPRGPYWSLIVLLSRLAYESHEAVAPPL
jgi:hypothetical protein